MSTNIDALREAFETWGKPEWFWGSNEYAYFETCNEYNDREVQAAWEAYQAAHNKQQAEIDRLNRRLSQVLSTQGQSNSPWYDNGQHQTFTDEWGSTY